jgi:NADH:ubiquinone oxidoreductase subunit 6 (subunit J)
MRCKYCGSKIHVKDEVCKGCSAPVPTVNYPAGWALALSIFSVLFSVLGALNVVLWLFTLLVILLGFGKAKKRDGKGKKALTGALVLWVIAALATAAMICVYQLYQEECLEIVRSFLDSLSLGKEMKEEYWNTARYWFDYISLHFLIG